MTEKEVKGTLIGVYGRSAYTVIAWADEDRNYHETVVEYHSTGETPGEATIVRGPVCPFFTAARH